MLAAFLLRVSEMLATRNPGAEELLRDPYAPAPDDPTFARRLFGIAGSPVSSARVEDSLTAAHLRALLWIHRSQESLAAKRRAVQSGRRRADSEISPVSAADRATYPATTVRLRLLSRVPGRSARARHTTLDEIFVGARRVTNFSVSSPRTGAGTYCSACSTRSPAGIAAGFRGPRDRRRLRGLDGRPAARLRAAYSFRPFFQENSGPARARNRESPRRKGRTFLFLGDDTVPDPGFSASTPTPTRSRGGSGGRARLHDVAARAEGVPFLHHINETGFSRLRPDRGPRLGAVQLLLHVEHLRSAPAARGGRLFDTTFPHAAWEDIEIAYRMSKKGMKIVYRPAAVARHHHEITFLSFRRRQEKSGEAAAIFFERHPELGGFLGVPQALTRPHGSRFGYRLLATWASLAERWEVRGGLPAIDRVLRDDYLRGLSRSLAERGWSATSVRRRTASRTRREDRRGGTPDAHGLREVSRVPSVSTGEGSP